MNHFILVYLVLFEGGQVVVLGFFSFLHLHASPASLAQENARTNAEFDTKNGKNRPGIWQPKRPTFFASKNRARCQKSFWIFSRPKCTGKKTSETVALRKN